jgi:YfiH family protein
MPGPPVAIDWTEADWPAPSRIRAGTTGRDGGVSLSPFDSLNLAAHVGDDPEAVRQNRRLLSRILQLPGEPLWLEQTHSNRVIQVPGAATLQADAVVTDQPGIVCAVLTADCVPVLLCNRDGTRIAAVHAGWRGFSEGILENVLERLEQEPAQVMAWLGPHISGQAYEVGEDVHEACLEYLPEGDKAFTRNPRGRLQCCLDTLITLALNRRGLTRISHAGRCTYEEPGTFYSYRREPRTGRMASLIWMDKSDI